MPSADTVQVESGPATIVARPIGAMDASANSTLSVLQQVTVSVAYDDKYAVTLTAPEAVALCGAFDVSGNGATFNVSAPRNAFRETLAAAMERAILAGAATSGSGLGVDVEGATLENNLRKEIHDQLLDLFADSIPNLFESDPSLTSSVGWAAAAADMQTKIDATEAEILAQQLPSSNYELYWDASENSTIHSLPLKGGDTMVFVFTLATVATARVITDVAGSTVDSGVGTLTTQPYTYGSAGNANYATNTRTVAFYVTMPGEGALVLA